MPLENRYYSDLNITFNKHPVTGKLSVLKDADAVKRALRNLILTNTYERPYQPLIGASIRRRLFEPMDSITAHSIKKDIQVAINNFEPRVTVHDIALIYDEDGHSVVINIVFRVNNQAEPVSTEITLERTR
mgnify:CR=1 FL=1